MCQGCEYVVAASGESLNALIEVHGELIAREHDRSSGQQCMKLATMAFDSIAEADCPTRAARELCLTMAVAVHRLAVLQQIHGSTL